MIGDLELGVTTQASADTTTVWDTARTEPDGHWTDAWLSIEGVERRVTDFVSPGVYTVNAFPFPILAGMEYELRKDQLHTRTQVVQYLNAAIRDVQLTTWLPVDSVVDLGESQLIIDLVYEYAVPLELENIHRLLYLEDPVPDVWLDDQHTWAPVDTLAWRVLRPGFVTITSPADMPRQGSILRMLGSRRPREMAAETSRCEVAPNFVSVYAAKLMCLRLMRGSDGEKFKTLYAAFREEEGVARKSMRVRLPNNTVRANNV